MTCIGAGEAPGTRRDHPKGGIYLFATRMRGASRRRLLSLALVGGMALGATAGSPDVLALMSPATSSSTMPRPSVTATSTFAAPTAIEALVAQTGAEQARASTRANTASASTRSVSFAAALSNWTPVPGHPSYGMHDFAGDPYASSFGVCTWYAWYRHRSLPLMRLGDASAWPGNARRFGLRVSVRPVTGATVVFAPGVQGASSIGHVGVVEQVLRHGWLMISEMNFYWNGGGWGRVDYRYVHLGRGVSFII